MRPLQRVCGGGGPAVRVEPRNGRRSRPTSPRYARLRAEKHEALRTPRQLARFLCGISSPATTRAKLRKRPEFGQWSHIRFADVLALAERS